MFSLCLMFCGVLATPELMPRFWIFIYRCNPLTYLVQAILSTALANSKITCSDREYLQIKRPSGQTCQGFMNLFMERVGGYVITVGNKCLYCPIDETNTFLESVHAIYSERWRNLGIFIVFIVFNIIFAIFLYWLARVPKGSRERKHSKKEGSSINFVE